MATVHRFCVLYVLALFFITGQSDIDSKNDNPCDKYPSLTLKSPSYPVTYSTCGGLIDVNDVQEEPRITFPDAEEQTLYTLVMVDPDAPWRERAKPDEYWVHLIAGNIGGYDIKFGNLGNSIIIIPFEAPYPPFDIHRYQTYLFKQPGPLTHEQLSNGAQKGSFSLNNYIADLELGEPVAAFEFRVKSDF